MISSLASFLMLILYNGMYSARVSWTLLMYTMGAVAVARIAIEQDRAYSIGYLAVLALAAFAVMVRFIAGGVVFCVGILALIAYLSDRIVHDCTLIDDSVDASGQGLIDFGRSEIKRQIERNKQRTEAGSDEEQHKKSERERKTHQPGRTVMYLALGALPLFGLGQFLLRSDSVTWSSAQRYLAIYLFASLSLLVTTSFLGLRRYLRQRKVDMPNDVTVAWLAGGLITIGLILSLAYIAPMPGSALASIQVPQFLKSRQGLQASKAGWGEEGAQKSNPDASKTDKDKRPDGKEIHSIKAKEGAKPGDAGDGKGDKGPAGKQSGGKKSGGQGEKQSGGEKKGGQQSKGGKQESGGKKTDPNQAGQKQQSDRQNQSDRQGQSGQQKQSGKSQDSDQSRQSQSNQRNSEKQSRQGEEKASSDSNSSKQAESDRSDQASSDRENENDASSDGREKANQSGSQDESESAASSTSSGSGSSGASVVEAANNAFSAIGSLLKYLVMLGLFVVVAAFVYLHRHALAEWWNSLWNRDVDPVELEIQSSNVAEPAAPLRPFSSFRNPIGSEQDPRRVIVITFQAFEAWTREQGWKRDSDETPNEFIRRVAGAIPHMARPASEIVNAYNRIVYGRGKATAADVNAAQQVWQAMRS